MIGRLRGTIAETAIDGSVVVEVGGVGYEVFLPVGTAGRLGASSGTPGTALEPQAVTLHVHTHVREDAMTLFGFATEHDRAAFRALLKVSGVGPKVALAVLGTLDAGLLRDAVARQDKAAFKGVTGVGRKTVERLLVDLQDKLDFVPPSSSTKSGVHLRAVPEAADSITETVVGALIQMGYKRSEAEAAVNSRPGPASNGPPQEADPTPTDKTMNVEELLRAALSALA